jgi:hypothetical protein
MVVLVVGAYLAEKVVILKVDIKENEISKISIWNTKVENF